jgi:hypothetical protein
MEEARRHTLEAIHTLVELMCGATSESVRLNAAEAVLSRGWDRPVQAFQVDGHFANRKLNELTSFFGSLSKTQTLISVRNISVTWSVLRPAVLAR